MKLLRGCTVGLVMAAICLAGALTPRRTLAQGAAAEAARYAQAQSILGVTGQMQQGAYVFRYPRADLKITWNGETLPTALGFGSWTAFVKMADAKDMVMGDLVLLEKEINPVISALAKANIEITALHNHFAGEEPRIMFMHIHGEGAPAALAQGIKAALAETGTPKLAPAAGTPAPLALDTKRLEAVIGHAGQSGGGVFKVTVGRPGVKVGDLTLTASMGMNTWAAFVGTDARAHVAGDVAMTADQVNRVIRTMRSHGLEIVSVHNHMLDEEPRIFFLHYWGTGKPEDLAKAFREALNDIGDKAAP